MILGELLYQISEAGIKLTCSRTEDRLNVAPASTLTPELIDEIRERKMDIIRIMREDDQMLRTGIIQSQRQVFDLAHEFFGTDDQQGAA